MLVLAVLTGLIGLLDMNGAAAIGLYLALFAGVAWVVGAAWQLEPSKQAYPRPATRFRRGLSPPAGRRHGTTP